MLKNILQEINDSKLYSARMLSNKLDMPEGVIEDMVAQLKRMSYIEEDLGSPTCGLKCSGCAYSHCSTTPIKTLSITDKGKELLNR